MIAVDGQYNDSGCEQGANHDKVDILEVLESSVRRKLTEVLTHLGELGVFRVGRLYQYVKVDHNGEPYAHSHCITPEITRIGCVKGLEYDADGVEGKT